MAQLDAAFGNLSVQRFQAVLEGNDAAKAIYGSAIGAILAQKGLVGEQIRQRDAARAEQVPAPAVPAVAAKPFPEGRIVETKTRTTAQTGLTIVTGIGAGVAESASGLGAVTGLIPTGDKTFDVSRGVGQILAGVAEIIGGGATAVGGGGLIVGTAGLGTLPGGTMVVGGATVAVNGLLSIGSGIMSIVAATTGGGAPPEGPTETPQATPKAGAAEETAEETIKKASGRGGRQQRLRDLAKDPNTGAADRGWIEQEANAIERGSRKRIRMPPGKELAHTRGREAAKGFDHMTSPSNLQTKELHGIQHKYDNFGKKQKLRP